MQRVRLSTPLWGAARLWFDFVLTRGGFAPRFVEPLFMAERFAGDPAGYRDFLQPAVTACEPG